MNTNYLDRAKQRVTDTPLLINVISRRVKQLVAGERPLVKPDDPQMERMDLVLKEIAEGKLTAEMLFTPEDMKQMANPTPSGLNLL